MKQRQRSRFSYSPKSASSSAAASRCLSNARHASLKTRSNSASNSGRALPRFGGSNFFRLVTPSCFTRPTLGFSSLVRITCTRQGPGRRHKVTATRALDKKFEVTARHEHGRPVFALGCPLSEVEKMRTYVFITCNCQQHSWDIEYDLAKDLSSGPKPGRGARRPAHRSVEQSTKKNIHKTLRHECNVACSKIRSGLCHHAHHFAGLLILEKVVLKPCPLVCADLHMVRPESVRLLNKFK